MKRFFQALALGLALASVVLPVASAGAQTAVLLPNGKQQFLDASGDPLAAGSVYSYIPSTTTPKTTWSDPFRATPNTNPVTLDGAGEAVIYGAGNYRQVVKDVLGNTVWDQLTQGYQVPVYAKTTVFTSSGTFTPTPGVISVIFDCVGGGGGAGGVAQTTASHQAGGAGGGGGTFSRVTVSAATVGTSQVVTVGVKGNGGTAGNNAGGNGGVSSVGALCIAPGGFGALGTAADARAIGGDGGAAGTGDITIPGQKGNPSQFAGPSVDVADTQLVNAGDGGDSGGGFGLGGRGEVLGGEAGWGYGAGGGGSGSINGSVALAGGAGTIGIVTATELIGQP